MHKNPMTIVIRKYSLFVFWNRQDYGCLYIELGKENCRAE